jgi:hypothetical protein
MLRSLVLVAFIAVAILPLGRMDSTPSPEAIVAALNAATGYLGTIATNGGYRQRYPLDATSQNSEISETPTQIWVQSPGTPRVGEALLAAYNATKEEVHLAAAAAAAQALLEGQLRSGGWDYLIDFAPDKHAGRRYQTGEVDEEEEGANETTFDDDTTQGALRFLMAFLELAENQPAQELEAVREAVIYGLEAMIAAQYPSGAWPQRYDGELDAAGSDSSRPARIPETWSHTWPNADYEAYYTLNDDVQGDCIRTMLAAWKLFGDERFLGAALNGGEFLIRAQMPEPQPGWAQQYNFAMEPAWARSFEPPAIASAESASAMRILVELFLETGEERFIEPIPSFIAWLERSAIDDGRWARLYEIGSNRPIYGDRDGNIHYTLGGISEERRLGYAWEANFGITNVVAFYEAVRISGREAVLADRLRGRHDPMIGQSEIAEILASQDSEGRWLSDGWIDMTAFVANMETLSNYLLEDPSPDWSRRH